MIERFLPTLSAAAKARATAVSSDRIAAFERAHRKGELLEAWRAVDVVTTRPKELSPPAQSKGRAHRDKKPTLWGELIDLSKPAKRLSSRGWSALVEDLKHLNAPALARFFPRNEKGDLELDEAVVIATCEPVEPMRKGRAMVLIARGPLRRKDPQVLTLLLDEIGIDKERHRWETVRHRWDLRAKEVSEKDRFGVEGLPLPLLDLEDRDARIARLAKSKAISDRIARCILMQDSGQLVDALATFDIALHAAVASVFGDKPYTEGRFRANVPKEWVEPWRERLEEVFWAMAPWQLAALVTPEVPKGRAAPKPARRRLCVMPKQSASSKASLILVGELVDGKQETRFEIEYTGNETVIADVLWMRAVELDIARLGLA